MYGGMSAIESEYHKKVTTNYEIKQAIGKAAARHVSNGDVILINDGSTNLSSRNMSRKAGIPDGVYQFNSMIPAFNSMGILKYIFSAEDIISGTIIFQEA